MEKNCASQSQEEVSRCAECGKQPSIQAHVVLGVVVVKEPSGSLTDRTY